jgi:tetratricopeptide (TPR) repeat protein
VKQQLVYAGGAVILLVSLLLFGRTETQKSNFPHQEAKPQLFNIEEYIKNAKAKLSPSQATYVSNIEESITRGDVQEQKIHQYHQLASFWKDSAKVFDAYAWYLSEAAMLENSEKNLTFAARLIFDSMRAEENPVLKGWRAEQSAKLFEKAIVLDPENEDLKIDLGSCYVFGKGMAGDASETMKGIQQLLQVVRKDSNNMKAQMVLGIGGVISRQYPKAIERLKKVVAAQPQNIEAVSWLGDAYAGSGDKENAITWYEYSKKLIRNPQYDKVVDERIKELKKRN